MSVDPRPEWDDEVWARMTGIERLQHGWSVSEGDPDGDVEYGRRRHAELAARHVEIIDDPPPGWRPKGPRGHFVLYCATLVVWIVAQVTGNHELGGLAVLMVIVQVAWTINDWLHWRWYVPPRHPR